MLCVLRFLLAAACEVRTWQPPPGSYWFFEVLLTVSISTSMLVAQQLLSDCSAIEHPTSCSPNCEACKSHWWQMQVQMLPHA
jgi:hypothetical protein